jgi:hypothetical protein
VPGTTTRGALPFPLGEDPPDTDGVVRELAQAVATISALYGQGTATARPAASAARVGTLYHSTDTGQVHYCTGSAWLAIGSQALNYGTPGSSAPGDAAAAGSSTSVARADHVHDRSAERTGRYARHFLTTGV